jgi:hypothetical protein
MRKDLLFANNESLDTMLRARNRATAQQTFVAVHIFPMILFWSGSCCIQNRTEPSHSAMAINRQCLRNGQVRHNVCVVRPANAASRSMRRAESLTVRMVFGNVKQARKVFLRWTNA